MNTRDVFGREIVPVVSAAEAAVHDRFAQDQCVIPERVLMENAGRALAQITHALYPAGTIVGVAGSGHNGGDTLIALQALQAWGRSVQIVRVGDAFSDDVLAGATVILDGILGTGAHGAPRGAAAEAIRALKKFDTPIIAVDLPSGIDADSGAVYDDALRATATVTFGFPKIGLLFHPARAHCGRIIAVDIGFPEIADYNAQLITNMWAAAHFPKRPPTANKGTSGRLLIVAGSKGMAGAAVFAGGAAVHCGAGLVRIASAAENREIIQKSVPEATFFERDGTIDYNGVNAVVAGPGLGNDDATRALLADVLAQTPGVPTLLDADALNVFAGDVDAIAAIAAARPLLITPHPKEMSRLIDEKLATVTNDPRAIATRVAERTGAAVLLKGQPSIVAQRGAPLLINTVGSSDFAVAGMGDQLSGVTGAMLAAGLDVRTAAGVALYFGGRAGDLANLGRSLTPLDVTNNMARAFAQPGPFASSLGLPFITFDQPDRW